MILSLVQNIYYKFLRLIYIQLLLFFIYVPILICWGLPLSLMAIVGNILFLPFLMLFLSLSFFIFMCELCHIPHLIIHSLFSKFINLWILILSYGSSKWLIGFSFQPILSFFLFFMGGFTIFYARKKLSIHKKILLASTSLLFIFLFLNLTKKIPSSLQISTKQKVITVYYDQSGINLIIPSLRLTKNNIAPWFLYEIQPELYKAFGTGRIQKIILQNSTKNLLSIFLHAQELIEFKSLIMTHSSPKKKLTLISFYPQ